MNFFRLWKISSVTIASALLVTGCSNIDSPENTAAFGAPGGAMASAFTRGAGMNTGESLATGASAGAIISATTLVIAKHQATERQRRVAEERARAVQARMIAQQQRAQQQTAVPPRHANVSKPASQKRPATTATATAPRKPKPAKLPRYIAVDTVKDERTAPQAKKSVMIWDTQAERVVGNDVYDIATPPPVGSTAKFETYSAQYVGAGF